jgi:septal ring factor EnvC (AmiA/AmiB activator)
LAARAAESSAEKLKSVEQSIRQSTAHEADLAAQTAKLKQESEALKRRAVQAAAREQESEATLNALEDRLAELTAREATAMATLDRRRAQFAVVIAALERMALHPPVALIALPESPADTVRSALLLRSAVPEVEARAKSLRHDLDSLTALREDLTSTRTKLTAERQTLEQERQSLTALSAEKAKLAGRTEAERAEARAKGERLATEAKDLRELIAKLAESRKREKARATAELQTASLPPAGSGAAGLADGLPVAGRIVRHFGDKDDYGQPAKGVSVRVRGTASVVAPRAGTVVFAGPFRGLGQLLIIQYGAEYHFLLAGLSRIDAAVGDHVLAGEPVGWIDASKDARPTLYMELRRKGRPVNPLPWLTAGRTRVNG